ncbi:MAG: hypothetical protein M1814_001969 [Vezdaea aestivalis]|nr:MAG: hypothetical protein M1814_001969 [Vezdaea aestivalis]
MLIYTLTFNCGRLPVSAPALAPHLFAALQSGSPLPDLLFLSLQEIAPLAHSFWGGRILDSYFEPFLDAVELAAFAASPSSSVASDEDEDIYTLSAIHNIGMTAGLLFVKSTSTHTINGIDVAALPVGFFGNMSNKGAVGIRIALSSSTQHTGETLLTFIAAHLAPGEENSEQRLQQWDSIMRYLTFRQHIHTACRRSELLGLSSSLYHPASHLILAGDLNYRTSATSPSQDDVHSLPHPASPFSAFRPLLEQDQLSYLLRSGTTLHGLSEAPISFPPTYKHTITSSAKPQHWRWAAHRWPSWCDRILWLPTLGRVESLGYEALPLLPSSDHRPVALALEVQEGRWGVEELEMEDVRRDAPVEPLGEGNGVVRGVARVGEVGIAGALWGVGTWEGECLIAALVVGGLAFVGWEWQWGARLGQKLLEINRWGRDPLR